MKQFLNLLTAILMLNYTAQTQTAEDSVKSTIQQLFTGMKQAHAELVKDAFADSAVMQTIRRKSDGSFFVQTESVSRFVELIRTLKKDSADERIQFESIQLDGPLASVWTPYRFYYNGNFSHCGINSFQLVRINGRWKIQYLIDTRRKQDCK